MSEPIISFKNMTFQYHSQSEPTLHDVTVSIYPGEKILIIGPSGSGKSTFGNCINGLIPNNLDGKVTGDVLINGKSLVDTSLFDLSFEVGTVLQDTDGQFIGLTVGEDIAFALENDEVPVKKMHEVVDEWIGMVGLGGFSSHKPQDLSGGQKQRVSMAGVLVDESPILLFDEPLANLDPQAGKEAIELIHDIHEKTQNTVLIIEHRLEEVLQQPIDRVLCFDEGRLIADLSVNDLLKSDVLKQQGIREPLYLTAMTYAGVPMDELEDVSSIQALDIEKVAPYIEKWQKEQPKETKEVLTETLLSLNQIIYAYQPKAPLVLDDVSLTIKKGEMISLVGKNGAGKSTLAKAICGFIQAKGSMAWKGSDMAKDSIKERADRIGYVMQNPNQMISKKMIREEVGLGLTLRGVSEEETNQRVDAILNVCGLYPFRNWPISALSYGQKKRVTIASILVLEPEMIILDEPTAGQDFKHYTEMMMFLESLNNLGITIIMITHDMHLMLEYTDRAIVMSEGKVLVDTTPVELLTQAKYAAQSALRETSLFTFANYLGLEKPDVFVAQFTAYDREVR